MLPTTNPVELDHIGDIITVSYTKVNGEKANTRSTTYSSVRSKKLMPLRGSESQETNQKVATERNSWQIRKEDRAIVPKNMIYVVGGKDHHITSVREFKGSRFFLVLDTEYRDNA